MVVFMSRDLWLKIVRYVVMLVASGDWTDDAPCSRTTLAFIYRRPMLRYDELFAQLWGKLICTAQIRRHSLSVKAELHYSLVDSTQVASVSVPVPSFSTAER